MDLQDVLKNLRALAKQDPAVRDRLLATRDADNAEEVFCQLATELGQSISEEVGKQVIKEMNYLMREREEAEEDRFRRLDAAIRGNIRKKDEQKEKKLWKKKKPSQA